MLWFAFLTGIVVMYFVLGSTPTSSLSAPAGSSLWLAAALPVLLSTILRWGVIPRMTHATTALVTFIVGIAMAESANYFGLFVFPAHKLELFIASAFGIGQFMPVFARRFYDAGGDNRPSF